MARQALSGAGGARAPQAWIGVNAHAHAHAKTQRIALAHVGTHPDPRMRPRLFAQVTLDAPDCASAANQWLQTQRARGEAINLLLAPQDYQLFQMDCPPVPAAERAAATRWKLKDLVDFEPEDAHLACVVIPGDEGTDSTRMFTVVTQREHVKTQMLAHRAHRLSLRAIDVPEMALRNLLLATGHEPAQALLYLAEDEAWIVILWEGDLVNTRRFDVGLRRLAQADAEDQYAHIERLALEFQRTADAFSRQYSQAELQRLWLCAGQRADELLATLQGMLAIRVQAFHLADHLDGAENCPDTPELQLAVGAALRGETEAVA